LDIKPYVPEFDIVPDFDMPVKIGWLEKNVNKLSEGKDDGRFVSLR
jgi:hypothetical protein